MNRKIIVAQFHHETNAFCPVLADELRYRNYRFDAGNEVIANQRGLGTEIGAFIDVFEKRSDITLIPAVALNASPSGPVCEEVYDFVTTEILSLIDANAPVDGILLSLHGAMSAVGHPDAEGDLLENIRKAVGEDIPVVASLDLHANVTAKMAANATALIPYEQYPHTDTYETGYAAAQLMLDTITGKVKPVMAYRYIPHLLPLLPCEEPQIKPLYELTEQLSHTRGVCSVRFAHGFFMADIAQMGMSVMVVTDGDKTLAEQLADRLESAIVAQLPELKRTDMSLEAALKRIDSSSNQPIVLADASDNPGAGAFSDTTHILRRILERGMTGAALATIVDPDSVEKCIAAGVGTTVDLDLGGWSDAARSGGPLQVTAYVKKITDGKYACKEKLSYGEIINHGKTAVVEIAGNLVLITSVPRQPWDSEVFRSHGITPEDQKLLIVKSAVHFRESYGKFSREMITVALPGYAVPTPDTYVFQNWKGKSE